MGLTLQLDVIVYMPSPVKNRISSRRSVLAPRSAVCLCVVFGHFQSSLKPALLYCAALASPRSQAGWVGEFIRLTMADTCPDAAMMAFDDIGSPCGVEILPSKIRAPDLLH
jgi:hypothetical protein